MAQISASGLAPSTAPIGQSLNNSRISANQDGNVINALTVWGIFIERGGALPHFSYSFLALLFHTKQMPFCLTVNMGVRLAFTVLNVATNLPSRVSLPPWLRSLGLLKKKHQMSIHTFLPKTMANPQKQFRRNLFGVLPICDVVSY